MGGPHLTGPPKSGADNVASLMLLVPLVLKRYQREGDDPLAVVVRHHSSHFSGRRQLHELS